jgi:hypothetical protein
MSVSRLGNTPDRIVARIPVVVNTTFSTGVLNPTFDVDLQQHQVGFIPKFMAIRQIIYANLPNQADAGTFILWTNAGGLNKGVGATNVSVGGAGSLVPTPETVVPLFNYQRTIQFQFISTSSSTSVAQPAGGTSTIVTGNLVLVLEFWA